MIRKKGGRGGRALETKKKKKERGAEDVLFLEV